MSDFTKWMKKYYGMLVTDFLEGNPEITFSDLANAFQAGSQHQRNDISAVEIVVVDRNTSKVVHVETLTQELIEKASKGDSLIIVGTESNLKKDNILALLKDEDNEFSRYTIEGNSQEIQGGQAQ